MTPNDGTPGPGESFFYDRAGALTSHAISNPGAGLPDERQVYTRDFLGRVTSGDRETLDPLTGQPVSENLA